MAHTRRPVHPRSPSSSSSSPSIFRKKYSLRRATARTSSHATPPSPPVLQDHRPVLVPLHPNLRRLPSRIFPPKDSDRDMVMRDFEQVIQIGTKRKRVASANENALTNGRPTRGVSRRKRLRTTSMTRRFVEYLSDETDMDVDTVSTSSTADDSREASEAIISGSEKMDGEVNDLEEEGEDVSSTDDYLLHSAGSKQLARLRKPDLVRLYNTAGLPDDAELLTKQEIIDCLISARDDYASLPPSSPVAHDDGSSSGSLSDNGNIAGGEETDTITLNYLGLNGAMRRRVNLHGIEALNGRVPQGRSMSMGNLIHRGDPAVGHSHSKKNSVDTRGESSGGSAFRGRISTQSSPTSSAAASTSTTSTHQSPPATRLRSRKASTAASIPNTTLTSDASKNGKTKAKSKSVEFSEQVGMKLITPSNRRPRARKHESQRETSSKFLEKESDLISGHGIKQSLNWILDADSTPRPSPRRLRSKDKESDRGKGKFSDASGAAKKQGMTHQLMEVVGARSQKGKAVPIRPGRRKAERSKQGLVQEEEEYGADEDEANMHMHQSGGEDEENEYGEDEEEREEDSGEEGEEDSDEEKGENGDETIRVKDVFDADDQSEDEIDELVSSASTSPPRYRGRQTPLRKRLRPRARKGSATPDDGDVEDEGEDDAKGKEADEELEGVEETRDSGGEGDEVDEGTDEMAEDNSIIIVEPRKLRSGKVVGDEDVEMEVAEEDIGEEDSETGEEEGEEEEEEEEVEAEADAEADLEIDADAEGETDEEEIMEEEVDLAVATAKTLVRLRRDDLVRLCETRELEPVGTKPQLAEALLQWRDRQVNDRSSPSSSGTIRPPSTARRRRRKATASTSPSMTPILLRTDHIHEDEPRTPVPDLDKETDHELELDLESLGLEDREIPPEKLTKLEKIGSGGFKDVFIGKFKSRRVAISEFRGTLNAMDIKELKLLGGFDHPNIVRFLGVSIPENTKETPVMIVSELCSNGDLFDYIRNINAPSLHKVLSMMLDIARGLEYLHTRKPSVIHRDCKSSNILITARGTAKIADFGLAKVKQSTRSMVKSLVGTVNWQAPELWTAHPKYNHKVDVFSCAMVFWEILQWHLPTRKHPWEGMNEHAIYDVVGAKRQRPNVSGLRKQWCPEVVDLMERMWAQEHQDRPTMTEVVQELEKMLANR